MELKRTALLTLLAVALTLGGLWYAHRPSAPPVTWQEVQAEAKRGGYRLISTAELAARARLEPQNLFLVDTRQEWEYRTGHLEGAVNFPIEPTWWARLKARGRLAALLGPDREKFIVFY
jgi:3-mercaptopyruvate sulfurtransferase SseA